MRKIRHHTVRTVAAAATACLMMSSAFAQNSDAQIIPGYPPYIPPSQSSVYNQNSVYLPTAPVAHGTDSVRGAAGVSCQSAVGSGGPYLDVGLIGSQDVFNRETASLYGRIVVPLGERPQRPDCTKLYELEIARMRMELDLLRLGLPPNLGGAAAPAAHVEDMSGNEILGAPAVVNPSASRQRESSAPPPVRRHDQGRHADGLGDGLKTIFRLAAGER